MSSRNTSPEKIERAKPILAMLLATYPNCFNLANKRPLAIGTAHVLMNLHPDLVRADLRAAIDCYADADYYAAFAHNSHRVDLNGNEAGVVTEDDKTNATTFPERELRRQQTRQANRVKYEENKVLAAQRKAERLAIHQEMLRRKQAKKHAPKQTPTKPIEPLAKKPPEKPPVEIVVKRKRPVLASLRQDKD